MPGKDLSGILHLSVNMDNRLELFQENNVLWKDE